MLICIYGLQNFWKLLNDRFKLPKGVVVMVQVVVIIIAIIWTLDLSGFLSRLTQMSQASVSLPYVAIFVSIISFAAMLFVYKENVMKSIVILVLMILIIISNQFAVAGIVGNGGRDIEFKYLADWYVQNAKKGEKLVSTMANLLMVLLPEYKDNFVEIDAFTDANSPEDFIRKCYEKNVTYIAWDSRIGLAVGDSYYKIWKMQNIAMLAAGRDIGPYQIVGRLITNQRRYIYVYRLRKPSSL
jgi:hypothetical protein